MNINLKGIEMRKIFRLALLGMSLALVGCGQTVSTQPNETTQVAEEVESLTEETSTMTVIHSLGETEVKRNPKNIVVFDYGILDTLDELGIQVVGIAPSNLPRYLTKYSEGNYENVGTLFEPDLEKIYELEPELIIIGQRQASYYEELTKIAPTISLEVDSSNYLESFKTNMAYIAEIFGKEEEVQEKMEAYEKEIKEVAALAEEKEINGLIVLANDKAISVFGEGSRFGIIHEDFGVAPVDKTIELSNHGQNANFEYILEKNPDYIFVIDRAAVAGGETAANDLIENELIKLTDAYKNERIIYLDPEAWYVANGGFQGTKIMIDEMKVALEK